MGLGELRAGPFAGCALALLLAAPAAAGDLSSASYRLRGAHVASSGPAWLTSTAASPAYSASGASAGQAEAIGYGLVSAGLTASLPGFWPVAEGELPNHDLDGDGIPSLTDPDDDGDGAPDATETEVQGTDPLDPDSDDDGLCDGPPSALPACALGGEDLDGDGVYDVGQETDPTDADTDVDGWSDGAEVAAATDPLDPDSHPNAPAVPALQGPGPWVLGALLGMLGIARLRAREKKRSRA